MSKWEFQKLGEVADVKLSNVDKKTNSNERIVRLCNYTDVYKNSFINKEKATNFMVASCNENEFEKFKLKKGQVAITKDSETRDDIGVSTYISDDFEDVVLGYHLSLITPFNDKLNGQFLHYWFCSGLAMRYFENNSGGSGQRCTLPIDIIKSIPLNLPPLPTQHRIAHILSTLDAKIELNNRINVQLEAMAKTIYDYWFVQFDFPDTNGKPYKNSGGKMVWNEELKREVPVGWEVGTFGAYAKLKGGFAFKSEWWSDTGLPVIKIKDINEDYTLSVENCDFVNEDKYEIAKNYEVFNGDVVIALTGATVGKYGIVTSQSKSILVNQRVGFFNLTKDPTSMLPFLINSLNQDYFRKTVFILASGAAQPNISTTQIDDIPLLFPTSNLVELYNKKMKSSYLTIIQNQLQNQQLSSLRDWLLPMLMNGQVSVGE